MELQREQPTPSKPRAKVEEAKERIDAALSELAGSLEQGKSENLVAALKAMALLGNYSLNNVLLIASQRPDATRVAGFRAWRKLGRYVRKGEKGLMVIAPIVRKSDDTRSADRDDERFVAGFRAVHVFDVSQTEGEPLPEISDPTGDPGEHATGLFRFAADRGIEVQHSSELGTALGRSKGGTIELAEGLSPVQEFHVLAHELAHELMHQSEAEGRPGRDVRELEAEAVAFAVCHGVGIDATSSSTEYIQLYDGDSEALTKSLERIHKTATELLSFVRPAA